MRTYVHNYAELLVEALRSGQTVSAALAAIEPLLIRRRHKPLLPAILRQAILLLHEAPDHAVSVLTIAREQDAARYRTECGAGSAVSVRIDPTIIGGYQFLQNLRLTDRSYKTKLIRWYRQAVQQ